MSNEVQFTAIPAEAVKKFMTDHNQDAIVVLAWAKDAPVVKLATAGSDLHYSEQAFQLGQLFVKALENQQPQAEWTSP